MLPAKMAVPFICFKFFIISWHCMYKLLPFLGGIIEIPGVYVHCSFILACCFHALSLQLAQSELPPAVFIKHSLCRN